MRSRPELSRSRVQVVAIGMSAESCATVRDVLPAARIVADHWHVTTRAHHTVIQVWRRRSWDLLVAAGASSTRRGSTAPS